MKGKKNIPSDLGRREFYYAVWIDEGSQSITFLRCLSMDHASLCLKSTGCSVWKFFNILTVARGKLTGMLLL